MAKINNNAPVWNAAGAEPTTELKNSGFTAGYKPPAAYFNWFFNKTSLAIQELQGLAKDEIRLADDADLNSILDLGVYIATGSNTIANKPDGASAFGLLVHKTATSYTHQILICSNVDCGKIYHRTYNKNADVWTDWQYMHDTEYDPIKKGTANNSAVSKSSTAEGNVSMAYGYNCKATADYSIALCDNTTAAGRASLAAGQGCVASGLQSFAMGYSSYAKKDRAAAFGNGATADGYASFAVGNVTTASGDYSFAAGNSTTASGESATATGRGNTAAGKCSFVEGINTQATGEHAHAAGNGTIANANHFVIGHYNTPLDDSLYYAGQDKPAFIIGNGINDTGRGNCFRVNYNGATYGLGAYNTGGADYAEFFEWVDGNPDNEDRRGYFVTLDGEKIRKAEAGDDVLGVISDNASIVGNADIEWYGKYLRDEFNTYMTDDEGNMIINPNYNPELEYIARAKRKEWAKVGLLGVVIARDNGQCTAGAYCRCGNGGIAEPSESGYKVINRVNDNLIKLLVR